MNVFYLIDNQSHTAHTTNATTVGALASELGVASGYVAAIGSRQVTPDNVLQANDAVSFTTQRKTGGNGR